ncbi:MAG: outer membrane protein insertion porin family [Sphingobacteriales bacterium]|jgi:outer membrane protein insertion porin family
MSLKKYWILIIVISFSTLSQGQVLNFNKSQKLSYEAPKEYEIGGITISGVDYLDTDAIKDLSGLKVGQKLQVPGETISSAIGKLWQQDLFEDISISASKIVGNTIFLDIQLEERPRLSRFSFKGVKKGTADDLRDKIKLIKGRVVNENIINNTKLIITDYFIEKGFLFVDVQIDSKEDTLYNNSVELLIRVEKNEKTKIENINVSGNEAFTDKEVRRYLKETKQRSPLRLFKTSKYMEDNFVEDKAILITKYNAKGYRDAQILSDTLIKVNNERVNLDIELYEGPKYHFGNISWVGNTKYNSKALSKILGVNKGEIYNKALLEKRLNGDPNGRDIGSLYLDDGYLFFQVTPIEKKVYGDTIDLDIAIYEGEQATIDRIIVNGNDKTNDHVILREVRTKPGQKFSRSDIIRTTREISQLGYFDAEQLGVNPIPHPEDGTVDIEYTVAEKSSDMVELSGGFGAGTVVATLGLSFNNFSLRNAFKRDGWKNGIPSGDGQRLTVRGQTNGNFYRSYSFSFTEPWLGGKKPNSLSVSVFDSKNSFGFGNVFQSEQSITITGASVGLGQRLKFPDDFFTLRNSINVSRYRLVNAGGRFVIDNGESYNVNLSSTLSRNSVDQPIYPRSGSNLSLTLEVTPPFSAFNNKDYSDLPANEKYKFVEYHKWKFDANFFTAIAGNLVLNSKLNFGFLGLYDETLGISPFERFKLGGDGFSNVDFLQGSEIVALRSYENNSVAQDAQFRSQGSPIYNKYTLELRYPLTLNPSATVYMLTFAEGGATWRNFEEFNPFQVYRGAGVGVRIYLPVFGLLGLDYGWRLDDLPEYDHGNKKGRINFSINQFF